MSKEQFEALSIINQLHICKNGVILTGRFQVTHSQSNSVVDSTREDENVRFDVSAQRYKILKLNYMLPEGTNTCPITCMHNDM